MTKQKFLLTGDCHGSFHKFNNLDSKFVDKNTNIIILGDAGLNYYGDKRDKNTKKRLFNYGDFNVYCVRGNHDLNPSAVSSLIWDKKVNGWVYQDNNFPQIKYFPMWGYYNIQNKLIGIIGGAYSVDKYYRLEHGQNWFADEQLTQEELNFIVNDMKDKPLDLILTHTCPFSWQPTDLFLPQVDQNSVDHTTENQLEILARNGCWEHWFWGHFHADREYRDGRRHMLMDNFKTLEEIINKNEEKV